ncbi:flagellar biosynthesis anti-sigma factor FlgM [Jeotgalibacillus sp. S-D1]|uniref:flagellar biosynthesis anti-sigma factor FlgM n=1 Tax=Jeotgalibacillus sp. S-D1 TaxID=2552189 RepID=UPI001404CCF4|nr:flagellar biosynthesis anti-sigma factor FlgM [Jeotgalibacillus sp. S-D1]
MKINPIQTQHVNPYKKHLTKIDGIDGRKNSHTEKVEISPQAKEMHNSSRIQTERQEMINRLKSNFENGSMNPDAKKTAADLLKHFRNL